jgi:hypothetical protein
MNSTRSEGSAKARRIMIGLRQSERLGMGSPPDEPTQTLLNELILCKVESTYLLC